MNQIKVGFAGADERFAELGYKSTVEIPQYALSMGVDCFEYSFGKGVRISEPTAITIGKAFENANLEISVHAPYFINFANPDEEKINNSHRYLIDACKALELFGGRRVVFHPGSLLKMTKEEAFEKTYANFSEFLNKYGDYLTQSNIYVCPETMGKSSQVGTVEEVAKLATLHKNVLPCVDFGHLNARYQGILKTTDDYQKVIDTLSSELDDFKVKNMHVHFSKIEYGLKGEIRHLTFEDNVYGPEFEPLAVCIKNNGLTPYIISESAGTQGKDAEFMKKVLLSLNNK